MYTAKRPRSVAKSDLNKDLTQGCVLLSDSATTSDVEQLLCWAEPHGEGYERMCSRCHTR